MLGSTHLTLVFGAAPDNTSDDATMKGYVRALADAGLAVLFVQPGTKIPDDVRSNQARKKDQEAGQDKSGLYLATSDKAALARYVTAYRKKHGENAPVNLAIHPGRSRYVVIDADTPEEVQSWIQWWSDATATGMTGVPPTVTTPGAQDADGNWKHSGGGHWYLRLPDGFEVPEGTPAKIKMGQATAYVGDCYVLIPPSTRPEGEYVMTGTDYDAPQALLDLLVPTERAAKKEKAPTPRTDETDAERAAWNAAQEKAVADAQADEGDVPEGQTSLEDWLETADWSLVLDGWTPSGADKCGCTTWTAPGTHDSPKSAVTHECGDHTDGGRLHVWTDNPSTGTAMDDAVANGVRDFSKLQAVAYLYHDGDVVEAMDEMGIDRSTVTSGGRMLTPADLKKGKPAKDPDAAISPDDWDDDADPLESDGPPFGLVPIGELWDMVPPDFIVADTIQDRALTAIIGPSGAGKSFVALDMLCSIVTGMKWQGRDTLHRKVLYVAGEGVAGAIQRVKAWVETYGHEAEIQANLFVIPSAVALHDWGVHQWRTLRDEIRAREIGLVVLDTWARVTAGMEENSSKEVGHVIKHLDRMRDRTGAGMMVVHHTTRGTTHGRGSTALLGALDSELLVVPGAEEGTMEVTVTKQKNAREWGDSMVFSLAPVGESAVLADADGFTGTDRPADHFYRTEGTQETTAALALRMRDLLANRDSLGASPADLATISKKPHETASPAEWKRITGEAISLAIDFGLLVRSEDKGPWHASGEETRARFAQVHHLD